MNKTERILYRLGNLDRQIKEYGNEIKGLFAEKYSYMDHFLTTSTPEECNVGPGEDKESERKMLQQMKNAYDERIIRHTKHLKELRTEFDDIKWKVSNAGLTDVEHEYLRLRYFDRISVILIADKLGYSERQTQRMRLSIIRKIDEALLPG